jgi:hypothetical protein
LIWRGPLTFLERIGDCNTKCDLPFTASRHGDGLDALCSRYIITSLASSSTTLMVAILLLTLTLTLSARREFVRVSSRIPRRILDLNTNKISTIHVLSVTRPGRTLAFESRHVLQLRLHMTCEPSTGGALQSGSDSWTNTAIAHGEATPTRAGNCTATQLESQDIVVLHENVDARSSAKRRFPMRRASCINNIQHLSWPRPSLNIAFQIYNQAVEYCKCKHSPLVSNRDNFSRCTSSQYRPFEHPEQAPHTNTAEVSYKPSNSTMRMRGRGNFTVVTWRDKWRAWAVVLAIFWLELN